VESICCTHGDGVALIDETTPTFWMVDKSAAAISRTSATPDDWVHVAAAGDCAG
jgi:hypothetical protein